MPIFNTNLLKETIMNPLDAYIGQKMKRYAARHTPPANGRYTLLKTAAATSNTVKNNNNKKMKGCQPVFWKRIYEDQQSNSWSFQLFDWTPIYSFGVMNMRHVM